MSLVAYAEIPEGVKCVMSSDAFFNVRTLLQDDDFTRLVLKKVDLAEYGSSNAFVDRNGVLQPKNYLSTGTKVLLNIHYNKDVCFFVGECGDTALGYISYLTDGIVYWPDWVTARVVDNFDCDIVFNGKRYTNFANYLNFRYYGEDWEDD